MKQLTLSNLIGRCIVSCMLVLLTQLALSLVPRFLSASSLLIQLPLSALLLLVVIGLGGRIRRVLGVHASAPAFVFFSILFVWCVYVLVIRKAVSHVMDVVFNGEVAILIIGLCSILKSDPGLEMYGSSEDRCIEDSTSGVNSQNQELELSDSFLGKRVRHCRSCKAYIRGLDHHCPAFGNCIGQKNYILFVILLVGFIITEGSYVACSTQFASKFGIFNGTMSETSLFANLAVSTTTFSILQLVWQVPFLTWHAYCICFNIRTDEWINWKKYPEFQFVDQSQPGQSCREVRFTNPYDRGILQNVKEFLALTG
ncbi:probable protein S-acyltransferase 15 isoform X2 [Ziziphus jujuba]|uniref:S-acyltransferase n=1 Tax=Ziziphus jujuba TaxID=326968 RepID=A0A6P3Z9F9_ZIZJJ|nr:probable protein S-acyltransferase 15 isoform X2 [Ziziphus jujuba]